MPASAKHRNTGTCCSVVLGRALQVQIGLTQVRGAISSTASLQTRLVVEPPSMSSSACCARMANRCSQNQPDVIRAFAANASGDLLTEHLASACPAHRDGECGTVVQAASARSLRLQASAPPLRLWPANPGVTQPRNADPARTFTGDAVWLRKRCAGSPCSADDASRLSGSDGGAIGTALESQSDRRGVEAAKH